MFFVHKSYEVRAEYLVKIDGPLLIRVREQRYIPVRRNKRKLTKMLIRRGQRKGFRMSEDEYKIELGKNSTTQLNKSETTYQNTLPKSGNEFYSGII